MATSDQSAPDMAAGRQLVSIIVPAYNAERHLAATLAAALAQTHQEIEVLVVDDGSTDATASIAASFVDRDPRLHLIRQRNSGVAAARNRALEAARGTFVAPLDADDLWHPEKLALELAALTSAGTAAALVYCWYSTVDEEGRVLGRSASTARFAGDVLARLVLSNFLGNASTPLMRAEAVRQAGGYDPSLRAAGAQGCEDYQLYLHLAERHRFAVVPQFLVGYRRTAAAMSADARQMLRSYDLVMKRLRHRRPDLSPDLFRRSRRSICFWLAARAARDGRPIDAAAVLAGIAARDPMILLAAETRPYIKRTRRRFARDLGLSRPKADGCEGLSFLALPPTLGVPRSAALASNENETNLCSS